MKDKKVSDKPKRTITFEACTPIERGNEMIKKISQGVSDEH